MRTDYRLDNKRVIAPNASLLGEGTRIVKRDSFFTYENNGRESLARSLGRLVPTSGDDCGVVYVLAMVLSSDATFCCVRWIRPDEITRVVPSPSKLAAFFFAPTLPHDPETMLRLIDYGTVSERYIDNAASHVAEWNAA